MAKKHDNKFKVMIVELLKSVSKPKQLGEEYSLNPGIDGNESFEQNLVISLKRECFL